MMSRLKSILGVIAGAAVGSIVNMGLILLGGVLIPPPEGVDLVNVDSLAASIHLFEAKHFIFPFLAHALGTLSGAVLAAYMTAGNKLYAALIVGGVFLVGGIQNMSLIPAPMWFNVTDLVLAYLPMGWLGFMIYGKYIQTKVEVGAETE